MHLYAFGSLCRGEVTIGSDIDILACVLNEDKSINKEKFSVYKYSSIEKLWSEGNPFAWHLYIESKLIYSSNNKDFIKDLGAPKAYTNALEDCEKFKELFIQSYDALLDSDRNSIFNISCMFLATRNFATCYSLGIGHPVFSRNSPLLIENKLEISDEVFNTLICARILSTRGYGEILDGDQINGVRASSQAIIEWMNRLSKAN